MLKYKSLIILLIAILPAVAGQAQSAGSAEATTNTVSEAIRKANPASLTQAGGSSIDLTLPGSDGTFSRSQAEMILREFFRKNPPKSFTIRQQGTSNDGSRFTIGTFTDANNQVFRVYFLVKRVNGNFLLQLLQFESE